VLHNSTTSTLGKEGAVSSAKADGRRGRSTQLLIIFFLLIIAVIVTLIWKAASNRNRAIVGVADLAGHTRPVDIQAFRNLVDPGEDEFLRKHLPPAEFRSVRKQRMFAALDYVNAAVRNAGILMLVGEAARHSPEPRVAAAGEQMVEAALQFRLYVIPVRLKLWTAAALPGASFSHAGLADRYQRATDLAWYLGRLQNPVAAARVTSSL